MWRLPIGGRLAFYGIFSKIWVAFHLASHFCWRERGRAIWISQNTTLAERTHHVRNCAGTNTNIQGPGQNAEDPCVDKP
jgi:hypothetical protein